MTLDNVTNEELFAEISARGMSYSFMDDVEMIEELENRGWTVSKDTVVVSQDDLFNLYYDFIGSVSNDYFDRKLREFFQKTLGKTIVL